MAISCVYKVCDLNGRFLIASTTDFESMKKNERHLLALGKHPNKRLQDYVSANNVDSLSWHILATTTDPSQLPLMLKSFLERADCYYNDDSAIETVEKEIKTNIKKRWKARKVAKIHAQTGKVLTIYDSVSQVVKDGFNRAIVSQCCSGKSKTHKGYSWRYLNESE